MTEKFDFEQALEALKAGKPITGKDSVLSPLMNWSLGGREMGIRVTFRVETQARFKVVPLLI